MSPHLGASDNNQDRALAGGPFGSRALYSMLDVVIQAMDNGKAQRAGPLPAGPPSSAARLIVGEIAATPLPETGDGAYNALVALTTAFTAFTADPAHTMCAGHLHCPPLAVAVAADVVASTLNPSLDSWDQGPSATELEPLIIGAIAELAGYDRDRAGGVMTSGGTESNLMGLMLARDAAVLKATGQVASLRGLGKIADRLRIFCSSIAHFSVQRSAALLGLGEESVVPIAVDDEQRIDVRVLLEQLARAAREELIPVAVVATAGTTDFGSIDPLEAIAVACAQYDAWLHVDASYGGGVLFSNRLKPLLKGIEKAQSTSIDFHKYGWQPIAAGVFLVARSTALEPLARSVAYLNPVDDEDAGYQSLLGNSLRTTRRADVFKIAVTLRALGRTGFGDLVDKCHELALHAAAAIKAHPVLQLAADPVLSTVVFRYLPCNHQHLIGDVNAELRRHLLIQGTAVVGRAEVSGETWLKLTLLNPEADKDDVDSLLCAVVAAGDAVDLTI